MLSGILDRMFTFWSRLYGRAIPQLPKAVVMVPDTAQETPGRTLSDFLEPLILGRGLQVQAVLGFQGAPGPRHSWQAGPPGATPWSSRIAGKDVASGGDALERRWVSERNFQVRLGYPRIEAGTQGQTETWPWAPWPRAYLESSQNSLLDRNTKSIFSWLPFTECWHQHLTWIGKCGVSIRSYCPGTASLHLPVLFGAKQITTLSSPL